MSSDRLSSRGADQDSVSDLVKQAAAHLQMALNLLDQAGADPELQARVQEALEAFKRH